MARAVRLVLAAALLGGLAVLPGTSGAISPRGAIEPRKQAIFNAPLLGEGAHVGSSQVYSPGVPSRITQTIVDLLDAAARRAHVRIAVYYITDNGLNLPGDDVSRIIKALNRAARERQVDIGIVADSTASRDHVWPRLDKRIHRYFCPGGCYRWPGSTLMHNKFMTVDDTVWTSRKENVVAQMTANWSNSQLRDQHANSLIRIWGDNRLYAGYLGYWNGLRTCTQRRCTGFPAQTISAEPGSGISVAVYPRVSGDPALSQIAAVGCGSTGGATIDVAMGSWDASPRGLKYAAALRSAKARGCSVRIVIPQHATVRSTLMRYGLGPHCTNDGHSSVDVRRLTPTVHSKYMLVNGAYGSRHNTRIVFTGSDNWDGNSLTRHDETWMTIYSRATKYADNAAMFAEFEANFSVLWAESLPCNILR